MCGQLCKKACAKQTSEHTEQHALVIRRAHCCDSTLDTYCAITEGILCGEENQYIVVTKQHRPSDDHYVSTM